MIPYKFILQTGSITAGLVWLMMSPMIAAHAYDGGGVRHHNVLVKRVENGVNVWRPDYRKDADIPELLGGEPATRQESEIEKIVIRRPLRRSVRKPAKIRVMGFYSGYGERIPFVRGFYSGNQRASRDYVQGFYSGVKRHHRNRFPLERPDGYRRVR